MTEAKEPRMFWILIGEKAQTSDPRTFTDPVRAQTSLDYYRVEYPSIGPWELVPCLEIVQSEASAT